MSSGILIPLHSVVMPNNPNFVHNIGNELYIGKQYDYSFLIGGFEEMDRSSTYCM